MTKNNLINHFHRWQLGVGTYPDIWEAYKSPSAAKVKAWRFWIEKLQHIYNAVDFQVMSKNDSFFAIGCVGTVNGLLTFIYVTAQNRYFLPLETIDNETGEILPTF